MRPVIALICLCFTSAPALAAPQAGPQRKQAIRAIRWVVAQPDLPMVPLRPDLAAQMEFAPAAAAVGPEVLAVFRRLESVITTRAQFKLIPITTEGFFSQIEKKEIYFSPELLAMAGDGLAPEERDRAIAFVLGHELAHYVYEAYLNHRRDRRGPFGHRSYTIPYLPMQREGYQIHADIDLLALELMKIAGYDPRSAPDTIRRIVAAVTKGSSGTITEEVDLRLNSMERYLAE